MTNIRYGSLQKKYQGLCRKNTRVSAEKTIKVSAERIQCQISHEKISKNGNLYCFSTVHLTEYRLYNSQISHEKNLRGREKPVNCFLQPTFTTLLPFLFKKVRFISPIQNQRINQQCQNTFLQRHPSFKIGLELVTEILNWCFWLIKADSFSQTPLLKTIARSPFEVQSSHSQSWPRVADPIFLLKLHRTNGKCKAVCTVPPSPLPDCRNCFKIKLLRRKCRLKRWQLAFERVGWLRTQNTEPLPLKRNRRAISLSLYPRECFLALNSKRFYHSKPGNEQRFRRL